MQTKHITHWLLFAVAAVIVMGSPLLGTMPVAEADDNGRRSLDVAQNGASFICINPDGTACPGPTFTILEGATFVVQGVIYPGGTLDETISGTNPDGTPAFPDLVLGEWSCRGWFLRDISLEPGVELVGTQVWEFNSEVHGAKTIITDGVDLSVAPEDLGVPFRRAVTGGTGKGLKNARGEQISINIGFNDSGGIDSTHTFVLTKRGDDDDEDDDDEDDDDEDSDD